MTYFWLHSEPGQAAELWGTCQLCRWSGPAYRFDYLLHGQDVALVCDRYGCNGSAQYRQLREAGYRFADEEER